MYHLNTILLLSVLFGFLSIFITYFMIKQARLNKLLKKAQLNSKLGENIVSMGTWEFSKEDDKLTWSDGIHRIFGTDPLTHIPTYQDFISRIHPDDRFIVNMEYVRSVKNQKDFTIEHKLMVDGDIKYLEQRFQNFFDEDGQHINSIGTALDITQRKYLENSLKKSKEDLQQKVYDKAIEINKTTALFKTIFDTARDGMAILDTYANIILVNDEFEKITGYRMDDLVETSFLSIMTDEIIFKNTKEFLYFVLKDEYIQDYQAKLISKDMKQKDVSISLVLLPEKNRILISIKDVTDALKDKKEKIAQDQKMIQQSRLAQMGEMISMIAHQWRQPLNAISLTSNNLSFKCMVEDTLDVKLFASELALIDDYSQHLSKTIDDFRNFFKDSKNTEETSFKELVYSVLDIVKVSLQNKNITIIYDNLSDVIFKTHSNELKQVILNLIKNAEDVLLEKRIFNPTITISSKCNKDFSQRALFVKDNGGGIPKSIIDKIFDPYFSTKLEKDGTGLGLYMSKTIIDEHCDGVLSVSNYDEGAIFKIDLGTQVVQKEQKESLKEKLKTLSGANILLVEDSQINQTIILGILNNSGINIDIANDGAEAFSMFKANIGKYEYIIMDLQMPIMNGYESAKLIHEIDANIPIIAFTANAMKDEVKEAGMNDHLSKPIEIEKLYASLLKYIPSKSSSTQQNKEL